MKKQYYTEQAHKYNIKHHPMGSRRHFIHVVVACQDGSRARMAHRLQYISVPEWLCRLSAPN